MTVIGYVVIERDGDDCGLCEHDLMPRPDAEGIARTYNEDIRGKDWLSYTIAEVRELKHEHAAPVMEATTEEVDA